MTTVAPSLADSLNGLVTSPLAKGPACGVGLILVDLKESDPTAHDALVAVIDNPAVSAAKIADVLSGQAGKPLSDQTIRRHRKRGRASGCACHRFDQQ